MRRCAHDSSKVTPVAVCSELKKLREQVKAFSQRPTTTLMPTGGVSAKNIARLCKCNAHHGSGSKDLVEVGPFAEIISQVILIYLSLYRISTRAVGSDLDGS